MFVVIAYRWGWTNGHQYMVYAGTNKDKAMDLAQNEPQYRGGKYGTAVYEFDGEGTEYNQIAWFPGMLHGGSEEKPIRNWRLDMLQELGLDFEQAVKNETRDRIVKQVFPNGQKVGVVKHTKAVVPKWMRLVYARAARRHGWMTKLKE